MVLRTVLIHIFISQSVDLVDTFRSVKRQISGGRVGASFYPYRELKHTWRSAAGLTTFRVSDYLKGVDREVTESLAWYLLCRAERKKCPDGKARAYTERVRSRAFWNPRRETYIGRARNLSFRSRGAARDLGPVFDYVNGFYFNGRIDRPDLAWAKESPRTRMGFYHMPLGILAVNRVLDSERVPRYVLEFVVYHELLHGTISPQLTGERRIYHTREFRRLERQFARHDDAQAWLSRIAAGRSGRSEAQRIVPQV